MRDPIEIEKKNPHTRAHLFAVAPLSLEIILIATAVLLMGCTGLNGSVHTIRLQQHHQLYVGHYK